MNFTVQDFINNSTGIERKNITVISDSEFPNVRELELEESLNQKVNDLHFYAVSKEVYVILYV